METAILRCVLHVIFICWDRITILTMATIGLLENGPMFDWSRDANMYKNFQAWKQRVLMVFKSALRSADEPAKCEYLKYWLGKEGLPLIERWTKTGKIPTAEPGDAGNKLDTYWTLLEAECKPKGNRILSVMALWSTQAHQGSMPLNDWITKVYNMVEACEYPADTKNDLIRDVLISGCKSTKAKDKFIRATDELTLDGVIAILQIEESTLQSMQNMNSNGEMSAQVHYARYDKRKQSRSKNADSNDDKKCFHCGFSFVKDHLKSCPAKDKECNFCGVKGHFAKCCGKAGKFPRDGQKNAHSTAKKDDSSTSSSEKKTMHTLQSVQESGPIMYYNEDGAIQFKN